MILNDISDLTPRKLKVLKHLQDNNAPLREIKYVSHFLRSKLQTTPSITSATLNHDSMISKNLWSYVKRLLKKRSSLSPSSHWTIVLTFSARLSLVHFPISNLLFPAGYLSLKLLPTVLIFSHQAIKKSQLSYDAWNPLLLPVL